jgi:ABC-type antimicrobial peptide transport system permease subunit
MPRPHFFVPMRQKTRTDQQVYFFVRAARDPLSLSARFRREVAAVDTRAAAVDVMPLEEWTNVTLLPQKVTASMAGALGLISLILAAVGLYSVMAYAVNQRTREIGIRMALGARPRNVLGDVLMRGLTLTAGGLVVGTAAGLIVMRLAGTMLVDVNATDPPVYIGTAAFLAGVGLLASYLPARRATRINPMSALREE